MRIRRTLSTMVVAAVAASSAMLAIAAPASADEVWHQSIGRASASAQCPTSTAEELGAGWSAWGASWEQWNNNGQGGFVCSRSITWASHATSVRCLQAQLEDLPYFSALWIDFNANFVAPIGSTLFTDSGCTSVSLDTTVYDVVYAASLALAMQMCNEVQAGYVAYTPGAAADSIYLCDVM